MKTILFVCTGNTCRSSMAEAIFKDLLEKEQHSLGDLRVVSAGTSAMVGDLASCASKEVIREKGISLENHRAKPLTKELIEDADLVLTMTSNHKHNVLNLCPEAKDKVFTLKEYVNNGHQLDDVLEEMNNVYKNINARKQRFMQENQKRLKELKEKRDVLLRELKSIEAEVVRIEKDFREEIAEHEDQLIYLKTRIPDLDIPDPFGQPLEAYRHSAKEIEENLKKLLKKLSKK